MRMMLERAMGRASSTLSPGHRHVTVQVTLPLILLKFQRAVFDFIKTSDFLFYAQRQICGSLYVPMHAGVVVYLLYCFIFIFLIFSIALRKDVSSLSSFKMIIKLKVKEIFSS